jgi:hypothetical protein
MRKKHTIPAGLQELENGCGVTAGWIALRANRKRVAWRRLAKFCRYNRGTGTFAISIAVALKKCGLPVSFCTDTDSDQQPKEIVGYRAAKRLGISIHPALELRELKRMCREKTVIVLFNARNGEGHFSPVLSIDSATISFAYADEPILSLRVFRSRWRAPGVCRQAIIVG